MAKTERKLKICDITTFYSSCGGGVSSYLRHKAEISRNYRQLELLRILPAEADRFFIEGNVRSYWVKSKTVGFNKHYRYLLNYFKIAAILKREKPDIVEVACPYWLLLYMLYLRKKMPAMKVFGFYRADVPDTYLEPFFNKHLPLLKNIAKKICWRYLRAVYNRLTATLVHSEAMAKKLRGQGIKNIRIVGNIVDTATFSVAAKDADWRQSLSDGDSQRKLLLYSGRLSPEKGIDLLIKLADKWRQQKKNYCLVVVGEGPLRSLIERAEKDNRLIKYLPAIADRQKLATLYHSVDLLLVPCRFETFGLAALEAIAAELPLVGWRGTGGLAELIRPGVGQLVESDNWLVFYQAIEAALEKKEKWYKRQVREEIVADYQPQKVFARLLGAYANRQSTVGHS